MPAVPAIQPAYDKLIVSVREAMARGLARAQKALEYERLRTYWTIGKTINAYLKKNPDAAKCGEAFLRQVAADLNKQGGIKISNDTVARSVQFQRSYPEFPKDAPLTFTHYLVLLRVRDQAQRVKFEAQAIKTGMTVSRLKEEVALLKIGNKPAAVCSRKILSFERGEPYVYLIQTVEDISGKKVLRVDCGFKIQRGIPPGNIKITEGNRIVRVVKQGESYALRTCQKLRDKRYTYAATVKNVVDGDTFDATVDIGFGIWIHDRFRLKGINCPEADTPEGLAAKKFLHETFERTPDIVIRTFKEGMYGRWLADVFLLEGEHNPKVIAAEGEYLNQKMLDLKIAEVY